MKRPPFKFAAPHPGTSKAHADLVQVYRDAGYSVSDAERRAARDVEVGKLRNAVGGLGKTCEQRMENPSAPKQVTDADGLCG